MLRISQQTNKNQQQTFKHTLSFTHTNTHTHTHTNAHTHTHTYRKKSQNEGFEEVPAGAAAGVGAKVREFLANLRYFRIFIGLWNIAMLVCMFM